MDDCSRDGSLTLLRQLEARYYAHGMRVLAFASNAGLAASRNQALLHASYPYIAFLDADNELIPSSLPIMMQTLQQTGAAVAYGNLLVRFAGARCAHQVLSSESMQGKIFHANYIDAFSMVDRTQILDTGGYDAHCQTWEDYDLWLHLVTNGRRIVFVPIVLGYYYILPGSMAQDVDKWKAAKARINRIYNQLGVRPELAMKTTMARYHPEVGYV
jgi:glycosyltransferase involved in cell wall biosynthesis